MRTNVSFGVSFTREKLKEIDLRRGYISRSKWILLALEAMTEILENKTSQSQQVCRQVVTETSGFMPTTKEQLTQNNG
jgi:hypothetical protein